MMRRLDAMCPFCPTCKDHHQNRAHQPCRHHPPSKRANNTAIAHRTAAPTYRVHQLGPCDMPRVLPEDLWKVISSLHACTLTHLDKATARNGYPTPVPGLTRARASRKRSKPSFMTEAVKIKSKSNGQEEILQYGYIVRAACQTCQVNRRRHTRKSKRAASNTMTSNNAWRELVRHGLGVVPIIANTSSDGTWQCDVYILQHTAHKLAVYLGAFDDASHLSCSCALTERFKLDSRRRRSSIE